MNKRHLNLSPLLNNRGSIYSDIKTPSICVASLGLYHIGILHGLWIDATQEVKVIEQEIAEMMAKSPFSNSPWMIHHAKGFGTLTIREDESIAQVHQKALFVMEHGALGIKLATQHCNGNIVTARLLMERCYQGAYENRLAFITHFFDECYGDFIAEQVKDYIDYKKFEQQLFTYHYFSIDFEGKTHIFSNREYFKLEEILEFTNRSPHGDKDA